MEKNYFEVLNAINVNTKVESKNGLTYLSWAWAWAEIKKLHPTANYKIYEREDGCIYWTDGITAWVKTGVTIEGLEHVEYLPVMDFRNKSIKLAEITSFEVNKAIQRSLTKACARHGLGLYIYAGEDLPEGEKPIIQPKKNAPKVSVAFEPATTDQIIEINQLGLNEDKILEFYKVEQLSQLSSLQADQILRAKKKG